MDKRCVTCAFEGLLTGDCYFPKPQDGTDPPLMATAAMPSHDNEGRNCIQWRQNQKRMTKTEADR